MVARGGPAPPAGLTDEEGTLAVLRVRSTLERALRGGTGTVARAAEEPLPATFEARRGVFVTLRWAESGELRGCVGFPLPSLALRVALGEAALAAAMEDPRFPPVGPEELGALCVEVSVLTPPEPIRAESAAAREEAVRVGVDGLLLESDGASGLLLPQVAVEQGWNARQFLEGTCEKAGLPPGRWQDPGARLFRFQSAVFSEARPGGAIRRRLG
ncbi:MAG: TIGR00296 family protein [Thermoplasmata archaeon]